MLNSVLPLLSRERTVDHHAERRTHHTRKYLRDQASSDETTEESYKRLRNDIKGFYWSSSCVVLVCQRIRAAVLANGSRCITAVTATRLRLGQHFIVPEISPFFFLLIFESREKLTPCFNRLFWWWNEHSAGEYVRQLSFSDWNFAWWSVTP